ncbi:MAG: S9 family peptidase [Bacteroidales bacterium]|nr:S9 family peptidase [Bacteroidales bacterium]
MKKALILAALLLSLPALSQKKPLDHSVFDAWESVGQTVISPSGNVVAFIVQKQEGDGTLTVRTFGKKGREISIPRGYRPVILDDESRLICLVKPEFQKTRQAKIKKKKGDDLPKDSLFIVDLKTAQIVKFADVKSYQTGRHGLEAVAFSTSDTTFVKKEERKKKKKDMGSTLAVYHFASGEIDTLRNVSGYSVSKDGSWLSMVQKTAPKKSVVGFFDIKGRSARIFTDTTSWHGVPVFDEVASRALYLEARDTVSSGSKHPSLMLVELPSMKVSTLIEAGNGEMGITEKCKPHFSHDGKLIYTQVNEFVPPKDTTLVPFETPGLDIWNWNAPYTPPTQKTSGDKIFSPIKAMYSGGKLVPAAPDHYSRIISTPWENTDMVLRQSTDNIIETQWSYQPVSTVEAVSLSSGSAKTLVKGRISDVRISPDGSQAIWWDLQASAWILADIASGKAGNLTEGINVAFWEEEDDHPSLKEPYGFASWMKDGSVLVYDQYDIWKLSGDKAQRITSCREKGITARLLKTRSEELEPGLLANETIYLSLFDNTTKENGLASLNLAKPAKTYKVIDFGGYTYNTLRKAENGSAIIYQKGNFREPMDVRYVSAPGKAEVKLTSINPQIADYNWGTVELYKWTAFDGKQLEGLLYKPENFDASRKYPVIVYFYETYSEEMYTHYQVQPMWSIINIPFFVSRGYVVFVPDIVYTPGIPGESAYNCIVSGAQSLWQYPWIDRGNMAIQGQSWGGYQVAYLITRTNMFKCAGAGAPVSNMTSAYGGIRWESGNSRQGQYEMGQSRIGRPLWDGIELYMENSPLFKLPNVTTPVLIMHNDKDGAVPWYQGIEMFMGLRRLGKPAWLLEYNDEAHNLKERRNRKDLSIRLQQFFDFYLKGEPEPAWMRYGVPSAKKGYYFGYENAE